MRPLHWLWRGIWSAVNRSRMERDLRDELAFHLESRTADLIRQGLSAADARRRACLELGRIEVHKEHVRDALGLRLLDEVHQDTRYALRALRGSPRFAGTAILSLALGIGATTGIFSLLDAVILEPLPVARPHELVALRAVDQGGASDRFSTETFHVLDEALPSGQRLAAMTPVDGCRRPSALPTPRSEPGFSSCRASTSRRSVWRRTVAAWQSLRMQTPNRPSR